MKAEARGLDAVTLGATTALAMAFIASTDMIFCFVLKLFLGGERGAGSACACDLTGEHVWTGRRDRHGVCSRAMSTLDGRRDGSSIPVERAIDRSPSRAPRSDGRRYFSRGDRPIARFLQTRGVAQRREDASQSLGRRHRASRRHGRGRIDSPCVLFNEVCGARGSAGRRREARFV